MSLADTSSGARYVVSASTVAHRGASQLYFAALLSQRVMVGGRLGMALRRLRTIAGPDEFDHVRVARYPSQGSLSALRCSPLLLAMGPLQRRGVSGLQISLGSVTQAPGDWREVRAAWVLTDQAHERSRALCALLGGHSHLGGSCAFEATLNALPPHPLTASVPPPLQATSLSVLAFPSVRLALDALALPEVTRFLAQTAEPAGIRGELGWALMERVSLREMLTPG